MDNLDLTHQPGQSSAMSNPIRPNIKTWELGITQAYSNLVRLNQFSKSTEMKCHSGKFDQPKSRFQMYYCTYADFHYIPF